MKSHKLVLTLLAVLLLSAASLARADRPKATGEREVVGTVSSFTATSLILSHEVKGKKTETTFVLNPETKLQGTLANGARADVHYRVENNQHIATMVQVHQPKPAAVPKTTKPKY